MDSVNEKVKQIVTSDDEFLKRSYFVLVPEGYKHDRGDVLFKPIGCKLELQYKIDISDIVDNGNIIVMESYFDKLDIDKDEFFNFAYDNSVALRPPRFEAVTDLLIGIPHIPICDLPLFCLSNEKMIFGAGCILYPDMKKKLENMIGDFIIIPSSVHEVLIFPDMYDKDMIKNVISEINKEIVKDDEILSYDILKLNNDRELIAS